MIVIIITTSTVSLYKTSLNRYHVTCCWKGGMNGYNVSIPETEPPLYQLQDNGYTVIWAPILFATVIALSLVGILVPLWEFLFQRVSYRRLRERAERGYLPVLLSRCTDLSSPSIPVPIVQGKECFPLNF